MPIFVPAPHCAVINILGTQDSQQCMMGIGARFPGVYTLADLNTLSAAIDGWVNTDLLLLLGSNTTYRGVEVRGLASEEDLVSELSEPLPGGSTDLALPAQVAVCITKRTGYTGRSARGRMYVWGVPTGFSTDVRHITASAVSYYSAAFDNLLAAIVTGGAEGVVISKYSAGVPRAAASVRTITALEVRDQRLDTQRRRLGQS